MNQQTLDQLAATNAIKLTGGQRPSFSVDRGALRSFFAPIQSGFTTTDRVRITGTLAVPDPNNPGQSVTVPTIVVLGRSGVFNPLPAATSDNGVGVILVEQNTSGHILIAVGGNGAIGSPNSSGASGGPAIVIGRSDNLIIALGGSGGPGGPPGGVIPPPVGVTGYTGSDGGEGGAAFAVGIGAGNDVIAEGGKGEPGLPGSVGGPSGFTSSINLPWFSFPNPFSYSRAGSGGTGGSGGPGGSAYAIGWLGSYVFAQGGAGGLGGGGGPAGGTNNHDGDGGDGGDGGNFKVFADATSVKDPGSGGGARGAPGGPGGPGGISGRSGATGTALP
jgi:hypothetical protein